MIVVLGFRRDRVHPRKNDKRVQEGPPGQQQNEIEVAEAALEVSALAVGLQSERSHQRNPLEKKNDVTRVNYRHGLMCVDLVVGPFKLADHPQSAAEGEEHPEDVAAPVRSARVEKQAGVRDQRNHALNQIRERRERRAVLGKE